MSKQKPAADIFPMGNPLYQVPDSKDFWAPPDTDIWQEDADLENLPAFRTPEDDPPKQIHIHIYTP